MEYLIAGKEDMMGILELYKQLNQSNENFTIDEINKTLDKIEKNNIKYFIAKENKRIVGSCYIIIIPNLTYNGKSIGYIENVIIDEKYRRKGIGKEIMRMAIKYAEEEECYKIVLQSGIGRTEAHKFYESIGFNGETKNAYEIRF